MMGKRTTIHKVLAAATSKRNRKMEEAKIKHSPRQRILELMAVLTRMMLRRDAHPKEGRQPMSQNSFFNSSRTGKETCASGKPWMTIWSNLCTTV